MSDSLESRVDQFEADVDLTHQLVHGDDNHEIETDNGPVPSFANLQKQLKEDVLTRSEYEFLGDYAADIQVDYYYQLLRDNGEFWRPSADTVLPYTTTGAGMPEGGAFVPVGDAVLRQELEGDIAQGLGARKVQGAVIYVDTIADLQGMDTQGLEDGQAAVVAGEIVYRYDLGSTSWLEQSNAIRKPAPTVYLLNESENEIDADASLSVLLAAGGQPNYLGVQGAIPLQAAASPTLATFLGWNASDYSANTSKASISSIVGGYDNVNNAYASHIFGGNHAQLDASTLGHSLVVGGSNNYISKETGRSSIVGAYQAAIQGGGEGQLILGGSDCRILDGVLNNNTILNSRDSDIESGRSAAIISGINNKLVEPTDGVSSGPNYSVIVGGTSNTIAAVRAVSLGGYQNHIEHKGAVAIGNDVSTVAGGAIHQGTDQMAQPGDAQAVKVIVRERTASSSRETLSSYDINSGTASAFVMPSVSMFSGTVTLIGMKDGSPSGNNDGDYGQVMYKTDFGAFFDGTNTHLYKPGAETSVSDSIAELDLDGVSQANNTFTPGETPFIRLFTSGSFLVVVNAGTSSIINWVATIDGVMTRVG